MREGVDMTVKSDVYTKLSNELGESERGLTINHEGKRKIWSGEKFDSEQVKFYMQLNEGEPVLNYALLNGDYGWTASGSSFWSVEKNLLMRFSSEVNGHGQFLVLPLENTNKSFVLGSCKDEFNTGKIIEKANWNYAWFFSITGDNVKIKQYTGTERVTITTAKTSFIKIMFNGVTNKAELYLNDVKISQSIDTFQSTWFDVGCANKGTLINIPEAGKQIMQNASGTNPESNLPYTPQKHVYFDGLDNYILLTNENNVLDFALDFDYNWSFGFIIRSEFQLDRANSVFINGGQWIGIKPKPTGTQFIFGNGVDRQVVEVSYKVGILDSVFFTNTSGGCFYLCKWRIVS